MTRPVRGQAEHRSLSLRRHHIAGLMAKRKAEEDSDSAFSDEISDAASDYIKPQPKKRRKGPDTKNTTSGNSTNFVQHPKSLHLIISAPEIRAALLQWYSRVHATRLMPWRKPFDPTLNAIERAQRAYEVWVSEIMLQQTQVATVIPFYNRWMQTFPTLQALAAASIDQVNAVWKGLGYYSRASRLLAGAQKAVEKFDGKLPDNAKDMEANIPGIGRYSAGAICSIAYGERVPVLDGNVHRLFSRLLAVHAPPKAKAVLDILWQAATDMVDLGGSTTAHPTNPLVLVQHPGDINQALIELGSTVCKVRDPNCTECPLRSWCSAVKQPDKSNKPLVDMEDLCTICHPIKGECSATSYPMKAEKKKSREELDVVNVVEWRSKADSQERRFLLIKRPENGLLAGLLEFPTVENIAKATSGSRLEKTSREHLAGIFGKPVLPSEHSDREVSTDLRIITFRPAGDVLHVFSHIKKTYRIHWIVLEGGEEPPDAAPFSLGHRVTPRSKGKTKVATTPGDTVNGFSWTRINEVTDQNIGTGVLKVWNQVKVLWEEP
ncbi:DNA glycosylase [Mycena floridula]|nr:DNA glycosylase [Mycena floridula]